MSLSYELFDEYNLHVGLSEKLNIPADFWDILLVETLSKFDTAIRLVRLTRTRIWSSLLSPRHRLIRPLRVRSVILSRWTLLLWPSTLPRKVVLKLRPISKPFYRRDH